MTDAEFLATAKERYGSHGLLQAKSMLEDLGKKNPQISANELPSYRTLMMEMWLDSKESAREKFTLKKYRR